MIHFRRLEMDICEFCCSTFLFSGMSLKDCATLLEKACPMVREYKKGDLIYSPESTNPSLGFVMHGECEIVRRRAHEDMSLNTLHEGESFGILSLFSEDGAYPTAIYASKRSQVLFFSKEDVELLIAASPLISINLIRFLANRAKFLNYKIAILSGITVEERLAKYLLMQSALTHSDEISINSVRVASRINCGRASLYRAIDKLSERGLIVPDNKKIIIKCSSELERM